MENIEKIIKNSIEDSIKESIIKVATSYNSPVESFIKESLAKHESKIVKLLDKAFENLLSGKDFQKEGEQEFLEKFINLLDKTEDEFPMSIYHWSPSDWQKHIGKILVWHNEQMDKAYFLVIDEVVEEMRVQEFTRDMLSRSQWNEKLEQVKQKLLSLKNKEN